MSWSWVLRSTPGGIPETNHRDDAQRVEPHYTARAWFRWQPLVRVVTVIAYETYCSCHFPAAQGNHPTHIIGNCFGDGILMMLNQVGKFQCRRMTWW